MGEEKEYKTVIFDLDGTLYFQKPFRICMAKFLLKKIITHPGTIKDIMIIMKYRKIRENWTTVPNGKQEQNAMHKDGWSDLDRAQYTYVAGKMHCRPEKVAEVIGYYMHRAPLILLPAYRDERLARIIEKLQKRGTQVVIYSDYPVEDKLNALRIHVDKSLQFAAADEVIDCMKPEPQGLMNILNILERRSEEVLMVGDRMEKDGLCAKSNDVDYVILESSISKRILTEEKLEKMLQLEV